MVKITLPDLLKHICTALNCDICDIVICETEDEKISALYAMAQGFQMRLIENERAGNSEDSQYLRGNINAFSLIAEDLFGVDKSVFLRTVGIDSKV